MTPRPPRPTRPTASGPIVRRAVATLLALVALLLLLPGTALARTAGAGEDTPLDLGGAASGDGHPASGGGSIARVVVGLLVVVAVIYGVTWILKHAKRSKDRPTGTGLESLTTLPLQGGGSLHLVRAADELLLLGAGADGATVLRRYTEDEARTLGLWPADPVDEPSRSVALLGRNRTMATADDPAAAPTMPGANLVPAVAAVTTPTTAAGPRPTTLVERLRSRTVRG